MQRFIRLPHALLLLSLVANIGLLFASAHLLSSLKETYTDYRHFRALELGTSEARDATPSDNSIVLFGDSRIETWTPAPSSDNYTFIKAGIAGETTTEMRRRFKQEVIRLQPDYVLLQAGMNDLTASVTKGIEKPEHLIELMHENFEFFISTLESQGIDVIVTSIIPNRHLSLFRKQFWHDSLSDDVKTANTRLKATAEKHNANWFDIAPIYLDQSGNPIDELYYDTLHINSDGYEILNRHLMDYIEKL